MQLNRFWLLDELATVTWRNLPCIVAKDALRYLEMCQHNNNPLVIGEMLALALVAHESLPRKTIGKGCAWLRLAIVCDMPLPS